MGKISKVVVFGMKGVGKTSILEQAIYGNIYPDTFLQSTIEDIYCASIESERGSKERVRFYDTGGHRDLASTPHYPHADGFLFIINPGKAESVDWVIHAKKEIDKLREKKEAVFLLLSNSIGGTGGLSGGDGTLWAKVERWAAAEKVKVYPVDAMDRCTLIQPFVYLASKMSQPQAKSTFPQLGLKKRDS